MPLNKERKKQTNIMQHSETQSNGLWLIRVLWDNTQIAAFVGLAVLYNCGMIFFIFSLFVCYIFSFGLVRLWTVWLLVQVFTLTCRGCNNHECHNKNPRWVMGLGCEWCHAWKRWAGNFGDFWKSSELRFESGRGESSWGLRDTLRVCWVS